MENIVYECKVGKRDELFLANLDASRRVNNAIVLQKVTRFLVKQIRLCIQVDGDILNNYFKLRKIYNVIIW
jgi:hypothetical protein